MKPLRQRSKWNKSDFSQWCQFSRNSQNSRYSDLPEKISGFPFFVSLFCNTFQTRKFKRKSWKIRLVLQQLWFWPQSKLFEEIPMQDVHMIGGLLHTPERIGNYCYHSPAGHLLATAVLCTIIVICANMPVLGIEVKPPSHVQVLEVEGNDNYCRVLLSCIKPNHINLVMCLKNPLRYHEITQICSEIHENFWWGGGATPPLTLSPPLCLRPLWALWAHRAIAAAFPDFFSQLTGITVYCTGRKRTPKA